MGMCRVGAGSTGPTLAYRPLRLGRGHTKVLRRPFATWNPDRYCSALLNTLVTGAGRRWLATILTVPAARVRCAAWFGGASSHGRGVPSPTAFTACRENGRSGGCGHGARLRCAPLQALHVLPQAPHLRPQVRHVVGLARSTPSPGEGQDNKDGKDRPADQQEAEHQQDDNFLRAEAKHDRISCRGTYSSPAAAAEGAWTLRS